MLDWIAGKLGYVPESSFTRVVTYYNGRINRQKVELDRKTDMVYKASRKIKDLQQTVKILRTEYHA